LSRVVSAFDMVGNSLGRFMMSLFYDSFLSSLRTCFLSSIIHHSSSSSLITTTITITLRIHAHSYRNLFVAYFRHRWRHTISCSQNTKYKVLYCTIQQYLKHHIPRVHINRTEYYVFSWFNTINDKLSCCFH
jgi:hypothetical protein